MKTPVLRYVVCEKGRFMRLDTETPSDIQVDINRGTWTEVLGDGEFGESYLIGIDISLERAKAKHATVVAVFDKADDEHLSCMLEQVQKLPSSRRSLQTA